MFFIKVFSALYPLNGSRNRRFVEKASSVAAESERARRFRDARAFSGIAATAARKRMSGVDGMEMSVRAAQEAKHTETTETGTNGEGKRRAELARGSGESAETEEEERREGSKARKTLQAVEKSIGEPSAQEPRARTGVETRERRARERSLRSFRPLPRQTALRPTQKSRALFAPLVQVYIYGLIPLSVVTGRSAPFARFARPRLGAGQLVCRCTVAPVIIAIREAATLALFNENNAPPGVRILMRVASV